MTIAKFSVAVRNNAADSIETTFGASPVLRIRSGADPVDCEAARSGTVIATLNLPTDAFANAVGGVKALAGTWQDLEADAGGIAGHYEIMNAALTTCHMQGLVSQPWAASAAVVVGQQMHAGGRIYRATVAGTTGTVAPSHTSGTAADGGVTWQFVQTGLGMVLNNTNIAAGQVVGIDQFTLSAG